MTSWRGKPFLAVLAGKEEDRFTEYLAQILQAPEVLHRFLREVCSLSIDAGEELSVRTQLPLTGGTPDLRILGNGTYLLFEAKVGSWLHKDQLIPYARDLQAWVTTHTNGQAALFLLAPHRQLTGLMSQAQSELATAGVTAVPLTPLSWQMVAAFFRVLAPTVTDPRLATHLTDFADLIAWRLEQADRPFTAEEAILLNDSLGGVALVLARVLVSRTVEILQASQMFRCTSASTTFYGGYNLTAQNRQWWFGVWIDAWAKIGTSSIMLLLLGLTTRNLPVVPQDLPQPVELPGPSITYVVPLPIRVGADLNDMAHQHAHFIQRYTWELPNTGTVMPIANAVTKPGDERS